MKPVAVFRHSPGEGPGYFATFLERQGLPWNLISIDAGEAVPEAVDSYSGLVFMGGPMSANDPLPWVAQELALIGEAVARDIPVLGHCLGGQLMAKAMGGTITRNPVKEIGWGEVQVENNAVARDWFDGTGDFLAFHWHGETFSLPPGATHILRSPYCANQAFALGPHLAMQCHVEMTPGMVTQWCDIGSAEIAAHPGPAVQAPAVIQQEMAARLTALNAVAETLYSRWIKGLKV